MNLVILTVARSGSSMVAKIFAKHGLKHTTGQRALTKDGASYQTYEWRRLKKYFMRFRVYHPDDWKQFHTFKEKRRFHQALMDLPAPWVVKTGVEKWPLFQNYPGEYCLVLIRRDREANARSIAKKKAERFEDVLPKVDAKHALMDQLVPRGGFNVFTDELLAGDYSSLEAPMQALGLELDADKVRSIIDPKQWHY